VLEWKAALCHHLCVSVEWQSRQRIAGGKLLALVRQDWQVPNVGLMQLIEIHPQRKWITPEIAGQKPCDITFALKITY